MAEQFNDGLQLQGLKVNRNAKNETIYLLYLTLSRALNLVALVDGD